MTLSQRIDQITSRLDAATPGTRDTLCINVSESSPEGVELARHAARDLRFLTAALKAAVEALEADRGKTINDNNAAELFWRMSVRHQETLDAISALAGKGET